MDNTEKKRVSWSGHYIADETLFKATGFANHMISEGKPLKEAIGKAANYYKLLFSAVALEFMVDKWLRREDPAYKGQDATKEDLEEFKR